MVAGKKRKRRQRTKGFLKDCLQSSGIPRWRQTKSKISLNVERIWPQYYVNKAWIFLTSWVFNPRWFSPRSRATKKPRKSRDYGSFSCNIRYTIGKQLFLCYYLLGTNRVGGDRMKFYGRQSQRKQLRQMLSRGEMQTALIYGRRRVGKSELIKQVYPGGFWDKVCADCIWRGMPSVSDPIESGRQAGWAIWEDRSAFSYSSSRR